MAVLMNRRDRPRWAGWPALESRMPLVPGKGEDAPRYGRGGSPASGFADPPARVSTERPDESRMGTLRAGRGGDRSGRRPQSDGALTYGYVTSKLAERQNVLRSLADRKELMCPIPL